MMQVLECYLLKGAGTIPDAGCKSFILFNGFKPEACFSYNFATDFRKRSLG